MWIARVTGLKCYKILCLGELQGVKGGMVMLFIVVFKIDL